MEAALIRGYADFKFWRPRSSNLSMRDLDPDRCKRQPITRNPFLDKSLKRLWNIHCMHIHASLVEAIGAVPGCEVVLRGQLPCLRIDGFAAKSIGSALPFCKRLTASSVFQPVVRASHRSAFGRARVYTLSYPPSPGEAAYFTGVLLAAMESPRFVAVPRNVLENERGVISGSVPRLYPGTALVHAARQTQGPMHVPQHVKEHEPTPLAPLVCEHPPDDWEDALV